MGRKGPFWYSYLQALTSHINNLLPLAGGQVGEKPVPVVVIVGGGLNMAGFVGYDELGGGQGHRVFVVAVATVPSRGAAGY